MNSDNPTDPGGFITDPAIMVKSGFYKYLHKGDLVMADKGVLTRDQLAKVGTRLVMPHFLSVHDQFSLQECEQNKTIASLRIRVERYMERFKRVGIYSHQLSQHCI